ncbi:4-(cytidine 5'-diphospho)-2-C-methyl-D-erythritol kinase [Thiobacter aerophilum]|uniref:4-diphosphocytidyl-2-C-methyl-D-erythritol kinase n=1 Tax=Thiobacter aerophilum TaxID=3121275 RepID=A0ABV0EEE9_9BURK
MGDWHAFPAPAKLNLFLHVVGRRPDGYHLLETVFRFIDHGDTVHLRVRGDGAITRVAELAQVAGEADLTLRAARLLQVSAGVRQGVDIRVDKRLPIGGGLGGGSSDAATVLIALNRLWGVNWPRERLMALGLDLGADVPVFVCGENAFAQGVGERLTPVVLPFAWYVVLVPPVAVSTADIFAAPELTRDTPAVTIPPFSTGRFPEGLLAQGHNDLQPVVLNRYPEVARHLAWLARFGDARMTGSGACVFAGFESEQAARAVFAQRPADMQGFVAQGLDHHPLRDF